MKNTKWLLLGLALLTIAVLFPLGQLARPAAAAPQLQPTPFLTPTPAPDGRILYTVREGDTLFSIAAISGLTVDEVRALNDLGPNDIIVPDQVLLLGLAGPAQPEQEPAQQLPTSTPEPSPTPGLSTGTLCILLFEDLNGDAIRQETELGISGGAISISDRAGETSLTAETNNAVDEEGQPVPVCFENLETGDYNITIAAPEGYNPTTLMNYAISLGGGDETYLDFGAQLNSESAADTPQQESPTGGSMGLILGIAGGILILSGIGLAVYALRLRS